MKKKRSHGNSSCFFFLERRILRHISCLDLPEVGAGGVRKHGGGWRRWRWWRCVKVQEERKGEQTFTCVRNYSRTSGVQMLRMRCVRHVMPSSGSCKVKGPSPPEGVECRGGGGRTGSGGPRDNNGGLERLGECRHCRPLFILWEQFNP